MLIDADRRRFVKLTTENRLRIYDDERRAWREYAQAASGSDHLYLADAHLRHAGEIRNQAIKPTKIFALRFAAIGQTYNIERTRYAVVSSPIKLLGGEGVLLLSYKRFGRVVFFRVLFDDETSTFRWKFFRIRALIAFSPLCASRFGLADCGELQSLIIKLRKATFGQIEATSSCFRRLHILRPLSRQHSKNAPSSDRSCALRATMSATIRRFAVYAPFNTNSR